MNSKIVTFLFLLACLIVLLFAYRSLNKLTAESVFQATDRYTLSGHADRTSRSFTYWNNSDPPFVPANCAACHSTTGFLAFLGEDGSIPGIVEGDVPIGTVITCNACHNPSAHSLTQVTFHSGETVTGLRSEAPCQICHQSRQSADGIQNSLEGLVDDMVYLNLSFINPHYNIAASTQLGSVARSGYQYPDQEYVGFFAHAAGAQTCTDCHNPHSLTVEPKVCAVCHVNVVRDEDFLDIRSQKRDYDGDLDIAEGIYHEITYLHSLLLDAIQQYARSVAGKPIVYADQFPYFFIDANNNSAADEDEFTMGNRYDAWTPRLLKASYNYQFIKKDSGGYVHNPRYVIQLLHDSLIDLGKQVWLSDVRWSRP